MSTTFTKEEKKYFDFLLDMGFYYDVDLSDKKNLEYVRYLDGDRQFVSIGKDGFVGNYMGKQIFDVRLDLIMSTSAIGPVEECDVPQQIDYYHTEEEKFVIFEKYKKLILNSLDYFEKHDHITGSMNEYVYNNYLSIAKQTDFIPKTMDELNQYAIKLRDEKTPFKDYIYIISSLMIIFLISNTEIKILYLMDSNNRLKDLYVLYKPYPEKPFIGFCPTTHTKALYDHITDDLFYENRQYLDNYFTNKEERDNK